ncbi:hypothetical protein [Natronorubrum thiooxidans]|uniref:Uncharacterized protein n=1 Tax=Natronorubrum thiooxidans TaxID=308853 RepID=A0A1N7D9S0_9EURY|nr:hypothetical protein [Natronorubrum thiooxidans]SIR72487.1 hypothetical protein SAMN05421752_10288 [Natronorubrum thiooxidans]
MTVSDVIARLEQPEYTGENRCLPCTVVNVVIAVVLATGIGIAISVPVGTLAFGAFLAIIRLRGYLLPRTPTITRRYLPARVLKRLGKPVPSRPTIETVSAADLQSVLLAADVATERDGEVQLRPSVRERWNERLTDRDEADSIPDAIESLFAADEIERLDDAAFVLDGRKRVRWESTAALRADATAVAVLRTRLEGWDGLETSERRDLLMGVRLLRDRCPACGEELHTTVDRLEHCCRRSAVVVRSICDGCEQPLVDLAVAESNAEPWLELAGATETAVEADD